MSKFSIERLDINNFNLWDKYVIEHSNGSIFQTTAWLKRLSDEVIVIVCIDKTDRIVGGVSLIQTRRFGIKGFHLPPLTTYFGPIFTPSERQNKVSARSDDLKLVQSIILSLPKAKHYDFMLNPGQYDLLPYIWSGFQTYVRYSYVIKGKYEDFKGLMVQKKRMNLKQALIEVASGNLSVDKSCDMSELLSLLRSSSEVTGLKINEEVFMNLMKFDAGGEYWKHYIVKERFGEVIAGAVLLHTIKRGTALLSAVSNKHRTSHNYANLLAYDSMIRFCLDTGRTFDFCGSITPGIEKYLRLLGGELTVRYRVQKSSSAIMYSLRSIKQYLAERKNFRLVD